MAGETERSVLCQICQQPKPRGEVFHGDLIHGPVREAIRKRYPNWSDDHYVCAADLRRFRTEYVEDVLKEEKGELTTLEQQVVKSLKDYELLAENLNVLFDRGLTFGQRLADKVAEFGGSWRFIIYFAVVLVVWITFNSVELLYRPFDPFPYILLNLVLSCLAAIQAPVILMSQNRQEAKDRLRGEHDYRVNLKAELEISAHRSASTRRPVPAGSSRSRPDNQGTMGDR